MKSRYHKNTIGWTAPQCGTCLGFLERKAIELGDDHDAATPLGSGGSNNRFPGCASRPGANGFHPSGMIQSLCIPEGWQQLAGGKLSATAGLSTPIKCIPEGCQTVSKIVFSNRGSETVSPHAQKISPNSNPTQRIAGKGLALSN